MVTVVLTTSGTIASRHQEGQAVGDYGPTGGHATADDRES
jgi:hypothetical protein